MLDIKQIRRDPDGIAAGLLAKGVSASLDDVLRLDEMRRTLLTEVEAKKSERNSVSKDIGRLKQAGEDITPTQQAMRVLGEEIGELDRRVKCVGAELQEALLALPNVPHESAPVGADESANLNLRTYGAPMDFAFEPQPHWDIGKQLGILEFERAAKVTGSGFPMLMGWGARLQRALIQFMLDVHTQEHGYQEVAPPYLVNADAMTGTGQLPKLKEDMYYVEGDELYLIPTAEVPVTNIYRDEIIDRPLPICLTAYTPCFRREAGAAGKDTRGLIRVHQFDKVEMVKFVEPQTSYDELERLVADAEDILQRLGLHYRVIELCSGDLSFAAAKCYDIELWAPGYGDWLEVSSCSNFEDFQARRAGIRYRGPSGKPEFLHTLNGSGVALPRLMIALLETYQQADGSVMIPGALRSYVGGAERIEPVG